MRTNTDELPPNRPSPHEPADIWRTLCFVESWLAVSGDLATDVSDEAALLQLQGWRDAGITHILDVRGEWNDRAFVQRHAPEIGYSWLGTHDRGGAQSDDWYEAGLAVAEQVQRDGGRLVVHCHMGVNRAPSLAFRILLANDYAPVEAIQRIRDARPIAAVLYAESALGHHHRTVGTSPEDSVLERRALNEWMFENDVDTYWIISNIRQAESRN